MVPAPQVIASVHGRLGHLTLHRPDRLNALNMAMVGELSAALHRWAADDQVEVVLLDGAGSRGLCAGGDLREIYQGMTGGPVNPAAFWSAEYAMNATIAGYPKPIVAVMDGLVLGGGVGISAHAQVRVVTERSQVAMPETAIGLAPDVGALYLLARAPGELGTHCALTGARLDGPAAIHAGLADHLVASAELPALAAALVSGRVPVLPPPPPAYHPAWIDSCYAADDVESIVQRLRASPEPAAVEAAELIARLSPTALAVTLEAVRRAGRLTLAQVFEQDMRIACRFADHPDLAEGIRAKIIDRDGRPHWRPADLSEVARGDVLAFFEPLSTDRPAR